MLVDLMNQLAHAVGLRTVVEGIETEDQMKIVRLLSCDEAQGFLIARPAPAAELETLLVRGAWDGADELPRRELSPGVVLSADYRH